MQAAGKFALVTGAARGIGRAIAIKLLERGAAGVCLIDIDRGQLVITADELTLKFPNAIVCHYLVDVQNTDQHERAFAYAKERFSKLHIVANNAGILNEGNPELVAAINFVAVYRGTLLGLEHMRQDTPGGGEGGVIINTASTTGLTIVPRAPVYCATKHAVIAFTRSMAADDRYSNTGVRLSCLCPWFTDTDLLKSVINDPKIQEQYKLTADTMMKPETVAEAFMQLVEDEGSHGRALKVYSADLAAYHEFHDAPDPI